jgi:UDP-galactopyranose mutase
MRIKVVSAGLRNDLVCFSHLRWDLVFQRPQHLLTHASLKRRAFYWEEPAWTPEGEPHLGVRDEGGVRVVQPQLPDPAWEDGGIAAQRLLLDRFLADEGVTDPVLWYDTPHALLFSGHLTGACLVYDCMDELSLFAEADTRLPALEDDLLRRADLVFTGGASLHEAKRDRHPSVHCFPSGVDTAHFHPARAVLPETLQEPGDQAGIPHPRLGFYGVLDERLDLDLLARLCDLRPGWQVVLLGPIAKITPESLPVRPNLHWLGPKRYDELPAYVAGWDAALMPFALNEATRFISPTKTPEFLAAGRPVVSTAIRDVARAYGPECGVLIVDTESGGAEAFAAAGDRALALAPQDWQPEADRRLAAMGWDQAWARMEALVDAVLRPLPAPQVARRREHDVLVVGAGYAGSVMAERLAADWGKRVLVVDRRPHIGGNAHDARDAAGVLIHPYGPHIFHTNSQAIIDYLSRFTAWRPYEHRVLAEARGQLLPMPINRTTVNRFFGVDLAEDEVDAFLAARAENVAEVRTSADVVLSRVGRELYEAFFQGYTRKQWGLDPSQLDRSVTARVPTRTNDDDRYFQDRFQQMPRHGYAAMFRRMLDHPNIEVALEANYADAVRGRRFGHVVFTGPVDEYFGHRFGKLPYRSLQFRHETRDEPWVQPVAVVNYPSEAVPYTRVTEFKHLTGQVHPRTSLCYEYPSAEGDPYYPIPRPENARLYAQYQALADATPNVTFVGRLATYRYYNMDQVVGQALATYQRLRAQVAESAEAAD